MNSSLAAASGRIVERQLGRQLQWHGLNPYGGIPANFGNAQFSFPPYSFNGLAQFGAANSCFGFCGLFINPGLDPRLRNNRATALNLEAYFEDRLHITPQLIFMFGAKLFADTRRYAVLGGIPFQPVPGVSDQVYHGIVPKVGLMFEPTPTFSSSPT